jgi:hypothetical protein
MTNPAHDKHWTRQTLETTIGYVRSKGLLCPRFVCPGFFCPGFVGVSQIPSTKNSYSHNQIFFQIFLEILTGIHEG